MKKLFNKAIAFTDIHLGAKGNSQIHNNDCINFVKWMVEVGRREDCETCFFLGDYHNNRASINIVTLNYSLRCLELLSENFKQVYFIPGNHDLYYRDKRDVKSIEWAKHISGINIIDGITIIDNVALVPWMVKDEYKQIPKIQAKYMFGHFELPHFKMNAMIEMPDQGEIKREDFKNFDHVYSGHFHKRQTYKNITYMGNCFPHNYADAGDNERGCMILEWDKDPVYYTWPDQPTYAVYNLSTLLDDPDGLLKPGMHIRVNLDVNVSYEEANFIKENFIKSYNLREITLIPAKRELTDFTSTAEIKFESVDQIVVGQLSELDSEHYDKKILLDIYRNL